MTIGPPLLFTSFALSIWLWLVGIRRYIIHSGETPITGLSLGMGLWIDWQQCWSLAKARQDRHGLALARSFLLCQIAFLLAFVLIACGI